MTRKELAKTLTVSLLAFWVVVALSGLLFLALSGRWDWSYLIYAVLGFPAIVVGSYLYSFVFKGMSWVLEKLGAFYLIIFPGLKVLSREYKREQRALAKSGKK